MDIFSTDRADVESAAVPSPSYPSLRVLMIGSMPPPLGGTTVSFRALCQFVTRNAGACTIIDTGPRSGGTTLAALRSIVSMLRQIRRVDVVSMHFSDRAAVTIGPILALICRLADKPYTFRQFGGEFDRTFSRLPSWHQRVLVRTIFRADAVFLQTKQMMHAFEALSSRLHWFPTAREQTDRRNPLSFVRDRNRKLRCLFAGHVSRAKGAHIAAQAVSDFGEAELSIYGSLGDLTETELDGPNVTYRGISPPEQMSEIMADHDVLLFPTTHSGEGYSGTLVEAAMVGLPIIANRWQSLPEMFADDEVIFIENATVEALSKEIRAVLDDPSVLEELSRRLLTRACDFDAELVFGQFLEQCAAAAARKPS